MQSNQEANTISTQGAIPEAGEQPTAAAAATPTESPVKSWLDSLRSKVSGQKPPQERVEPVAAQTQVQAPNPAPQDALTSRSLLDKLNKGEQIDASEIINLISAQEAMIARLEEGLNETARTTQGMTTAKVAENASIAAMTLSKELGYPLTRDDVLIAIAPLASYIEAEYGYDAGSAQSMIEAFRMVAPKNANQPRQSGVQSNGAGAAPLLGVGNAGAGPAATSLKDKINEAFKSGR